MREPVLVDVEQVDSHGDDRGSGTGPPPAAPPSQRPPRMPAGAGSGRATEPGRRQPAPDRAARASSRPIAAHRAAGPWRTGGSVTFPVRTPSGPQAAARLAPQGEFGLSPTDRVGRHQSTHWSRLARHQGDLPTSRAWAHQRRGGHSTTTRASRRAREPGPANAWSASSSNAAG